ncbi:MAG: hypothetical protein K8R48_02170 [Alphaproteobacteria bacterium]|nr:hypothetical protein [Alphaproteobacteria bacterium]
MKDGIIKRIVSFLFMPLLYINLAGLAAGAVWLAALSQWQFVGFGVVIAFFLPQLIPVLLMPAGILSHFMSLHQSAGRQGKAQAMFILSVAYILLFMTLWCVSIFVYAMGGAGPGTRWAVLLCASAAAVLPLFLWSSHDRGNIFIITMVEMAQAGILLLGAVRLWGIALSFWPSFAVFGGLLALAALIQAVYEEKVMNKPVAGPH